MVRNLQKVEWTRRHLTSNKARQELSFPGFQAVAAQFPVCTEPFTSERAALPLELGLDCQLRRRAVLGDVRKAEVLPDLD